MTEADDRLNGILAFADDPGTAAGVPGGAPDIEPNSVPEIVPITLRRWLSRRPGGVTFFRGFLKIYGVPGRSVIDVVRWNEAECWKFAWPGDLDRYWCFAGTAMGEQFAVENPSRGGTAASPVYSLDPLTMAPSVFAASLEDFFALIGQGPEGFVYEDVTWDLVDRHGIFGLADGVVAVPPRILQRQVDANSFMTMPYKTVMILNGDCFSEASKCPVGTQIAGITTYTDEHGRERIRFRIWTS